MHDRVLTFHGFLDRFLDQHNKAKNKPFCFIIGAGCSIDSGIESGAYLANKWLHELYLAKNFSNESFDQWATSENLGIDNFNLDCIGDFYTDIYELRFKNHPDEGFAYLENEMDGIEPSYGYAVLASILSNEFHKIVITTNFDNLIADAISLHGDHFPLVLGHDSLASYADTNPRRPLIVKIHGSIGFDMKNSSDECKALSDGWFKPLKEILKRCTPVVMGYAGNDGSLMNLLMDVELDNIYWLKYGECVDPRIFWNSTSIEIKDVIMNSNGYLVPSCGFDKDMLLLNDRLNGPDLFDIMKERFKKKIKSFDDQVQKLRDSLKHITVKERCEVENNIKHRSSHDTFESVSELSELKGAVERIGSKRQEIPWWIYQQEIEAIEKIKDKEQAYLNAISKVPESYELLGNLANLYFRDLKDNSNAREYYKKSLELAPNNAATLSNFANFYYEVDKDYNKAEKLFIKSLNIEPDNATILGSYANLLCLVRGKYDEAERLYRKSININPNDANNMANLASLLLAKGNYDDGVELILQAKKATEISNRMDVGIELHFYQYCHGLKSEQNILTELKRIILLGHRSESWNFERNIERAQIDNHPNILLLKALADVITKDVDVSILDEFEEWREA